MGKENGKMEVVISLLLADMFPTLAKIALGSREEHPVRYSKKWKHHRRRPLLQTLRLHNHELSLLVVQQQQRVWSPIFYRTCEISFHCLTTGELTTDPGAC